jgi:hypothetical protein
MQQRDDINIGSDTMDVTIHRGAPASAEQPEEKGADGGVAGAIAREGITGKQPSDSKDELPGDHKKVA